MMPAGIHFSKAPITEAIIDLRVELPGDMDVSRLESIQHELKGAYPTKKKSMRGDFHAQFPPEGAAAAASFKHVGFVFMSGDEKYFFQARLDGFTLNRLAPYESWEPFRDEARRLWDVYRGIANPTAVTQMGVRYINRLDLPFPVKDLKDYLRTVPEVSPELPQELSGYFMRIEIPQRDLSSTLLINQTIIDPVRPGVASVVLDIDVFRKDSLPQEEDRQWDFFEELRNRKNEVFEACITDQTRELFR